MLKKILDTANRYAEGLKHVQHRRELWVTKSEQLKTQLKQIAEYLNENSQSGIKFYVDSYYAFDETINGSCIEMPSITFRSGDVPMDLTFKNDDGNTITYAEKGFQITFNPSPTGEIVVWLMPHHNNLQTEQEPKYTTMTIINDLDNFTPQMVEDIIAQGMEIAFYSSYVGITEIKSQAVATYAPIGFRRYETTEHQDGQQMPGNKS